VLESKGRGEAQAVPGETSVSPGRPLQIPSGPLSAKAMGLPPTSPSSLIL